ncbi:hypothetical protein [Nocardia sp. NRRL S-836]|uniref:hypothetical protein n=1 Tax=Nocardia sp. NRRL S-836 TaxID=1519492 RepID=UPI0006AE772C|nr:hypothetical protein [Nocardia sp. NRRL S-836]KOV84780.1 hypothetical protein ADL03_16075 [Nocardia sp. NRRL S-836]
MSIYDSSWPSAFQLQGDKDRMMGDCDWSPPCGTSRSRYHRISEPRKAAFLTEFTARVTARSDELWITNNRGTDLYVGWHDDAAGSYSVVSELEHHPYVAPHLLRSHYSLTYCHELEDGTAPLQQLCFTRIEPPHALDVHLHVDHLIAWLDAHRRHHGATRTGA